MWNPTTWKSTTWELMPMTKLTKLQTTLMWNPTTWKSTTWELMPMTKLIKLQMRVVWNPTTLKSTPWKSVLSRPTQADLNGDAFASFTATMQYSLQGIHSQDDQSIRTNETNMKQDRIPIDLRMTTDDSAAFDVVNTATSSTKLHGAQDRRYPSPSEPWNGFEKRYTESEATSGSENGEIALLGGLEDVFDPVDELLPEMPKKFMTTLVELASETTPVDPGAHDVSEHLGSDEPLTRAERLGQGKLKQIPVSYESSGIAYLQQFGVGKYCELKQTLVAPIDELSQAVYEASHDDADLVFHALVGDDPLSDDWFHDVSLPAGSKEIVSCSSHLANRSTYDLIMANASPEDILAAELSDDDDEDFDLVIPFKYPASKRRTINPRGSAASSLFRRVPSAPIGMTELESSPSSKPDGESGLQAIDPSLPNQRKSKIAETSPIPAPKVATPSKNLQSVPFPPPSKTKLLQRKSIAAPSSIVKPPTSLMRPRSIMSSQSVASQDSSLAKPTPSGLGAPSEVPKPTRSLLQRRSFLATPSPSKVSSGLGPRTSSILKPVESSGLQAPRKSFGFRRPSSLTKN
ncbi:unnamed protein product [Phytophthora lilii]|uniref:Unnamed protein product n=1 Tax=Phytophthora lilii TaxID=2077276 RepID=A0A9W6XGF0_9STRA|nr:unnamed protein product [Phytophthora lilii]